MTGPTAGTQPLDTMITRHSRACDGFTRAVAAASASASWEAPSPCADWDARAVVEHVIGFHDVLLLRPFGTKPSRPRDDVIARWAVTVEAVLATLASPAVRDGQTEVPGMGTTPVAALLGPLTTDVLIHTWDLSRAVGVEVPLDAELCALAYESGLAGAAQRQASGMFGPPVPVPDDAGVTARMLGVYGRDPAWERPS